MGSCQPLLPYSCRFELTALFVVVYLSYFMYPKEILPSSEKETARTPAQGNASRICVCLLRPGMHAECLASLGTRARSLLLSSHNYYNSGAPCTRRLSTTEGQTLIMTIWRSKRINFAALSWLQKDKKD